jgi:hypothetical protein
VEQFVTTALPDPVIFSVQRFCFDSGVLYGLLCQVVLAGWPWMALLVHYEADANWYYC